MSEYEKMIRGELYDKSDPELKEMRTFCYKVIFELNQIDNS